jgi:uncharacterized protein (DUF1697 family)
MNLGRRRITNPELTEAVAALGFADVRTFRASGNLSFEAPADDPGELAQRLEDGLAGALGYPVATFVRDEDELRAIAGREPFAALAADAPRGKLQVALLAAAPSPAVRRKALALADEHDRLELHGRELYWLPSGGVSESALDMRALETLLGAMTIRTEGTIAQLLARDFPEP